ncbi:MAG: pilus assembly protein PilM [Candidatus Ratteibacteria bacterium]
MDLKLCIDIGSKFIKLIEGNEKKGKIFIRKIGKIENPFENFRRITEEDEIESFGNFLRDYLKKNDIISKLCLFSVSGDDLIYHYFQLPDLPKEELENSIKLEAIQILPQPIENYDYDYLTFNLNGKKNILLTAFPSKKTKIYTDILTKSRLKPVMMDTDSLSLINSLIYFKKDAFFAILNIGYTISNISIFLKNDFVFLRDINWGGKIIQDEKEVDDEKFSGIVEEIDLSLKYFENKTGKKPEKFYITGGCSIFPWVSEILGKKTGIQFEIYNPLLYIKENLIPLELKEEGMFFSIATGLLVRKIL